MAHLGEDQVSQFKDQGYLLIKGVFNPENDLDPIIEEYKGVLDNLAQELYQRGDISSTYEDLPFGERLTKVYSESGKVHGQYFDFSLPQRDVKEDTPMWVGPAVFAAMRNESLLNVVESIIGPEIYSNPVQHVRIKPPERLSPVNPETGRAQIGITPWHQDNGVVLPEADETEMLTVWFPLLDVTVKNGCLSLIPFSHREGLLTHCPWEIGLEIPDKVYPKGDAISMPMERGDVLFMHRLTCHSSLSNLSDDIRWSFDLRYNPVGQPTGRERFPGFVARNRKDPESELRDPKVWADMWFETRKSMAKENYNDTFNRWSADVPVCA